MIRKLLIIPILMGAVVITYAQSKKKEKKETTTAENKVSYKEIGAPLPNIKLVTIDKEVVTEKELEGKSNLIVMLFNPTCDHCEATTLAIEKNIHLFNKTKIALMAAPSMMDYLELFRNKTRYSDYPSLNVGVDSAGFISYTFEYRSLPQINIYNKERKLIKVLHGETPIDSLKPYID